jgi:uncharacterized membrane protein
MTSKDLLEQDYIKICPECGKLAPKGNNRCEICNHDLRSEPLYATDNISKITSAVRKYKGFQSPQKENKEKNTAKSSQKRTNNNQSNNKKRENFLLLGLPIATGVFVSMGITTNGFSSFTYFSFGWFLLFAIIFFIVSFIVLLPIYFYLFPPADSEITKARQKKMQIREEQINNEPKDAPISCPKCGCTQLSANKKGFSYWTGAIGSQKVYITCLRCGHRWKAGDRR